MSRGQWKGGPAQESLTYKGQECLTGIWADDTALWHLDHAKEPEFSPLEEYDNHDGHDGKESHTKCEVEDGVSAGEMVD